MKINGPHFSVSSVTITTVWKIADPGISTVLNIKSRMILAVIYAIKEIAIKPGKKFRGFGQDLN